MSFTLATTDSPFVAGRTLGVSALTVDDVIAEVDLGGEFVTQGPWSTSFNAVFGQQYQYASNGDMSIISGGGGGGNRPASGLVYPRLS